MFIEKYLSPTKFNLAYDNYEEWYLEGLDEENFIKVYNIFKKYNFYFVEDIIVDYLEIFELDPVIVENKILDLKNELGQYYNYIIGNDMRYLEKILDIEDYYDE